MGKTQSREEVIIAQNAAGSNQATVDELRFHLSTTNIILSIIASALD